MRESKTHGLNIPLYSDAMARPVKYSLDQILNGVAVAARERGIEVSIADIAAAANVPSGSIYHRFSSRRELLVRLWLRSVRRFQEGFVRALDGDPPERAVVAAALHTPTFCRSNPMDAMGMTLFRQWELVDDAPDPCAEEVLHVNDGIDAATARLVERLRGFRDERSYGLIVAATRTCPYGLVRPHVGCEIPEWIDEAVAASASAIAGLVAQ